MGCDAMHAGVATSKVVGRSLGILGDPGDTIRLKSRQMVADGSILAYYDKVCHLLGFYGKVCFILGSFPYLLLPILRSRPRFARYYTYCAVDTPRSFTDSGTLGVILVELGFYVRLASYLKFILKLFKNMGYANQSINQEIRQSINEC